MPLPAVEKPYHECSSGTPDEQGRSHPRANLEIAETAVLAKGFGDTFIEEVIAEPGLTKSGFFYHFKDKNALAREMLRRYVATNDRLFDNTFARAISSPTTRCRPS